MWDYIVVGAGTGGCVLAHELTESGRNRVLLIEAGGNPPLAAKMPLGFGQLFKSKNDWAFESEPQQACGGRVVFTPRGKMLGGSANINAQIHQWCHPADFDEWATLGAVGWNWNEVSPVFRSMECWSGAERLDQQRGQLGPMHIGRAPPNPLTEAFVTAARSAGLDGTEDYNGCAYSGAWFAQQAHKAGSRYSVYDAYLKPAMKRHNLKILRNTHVGQVLFDSGRAIGVQICGATNSVERAEGGVVLSAGAFGSPQLLMLSGIGPADHLHEHGIEVIHHSLEVGRNLQDHPTVPARFETRRPITLKSASSLGQLLKWLLFRRGMLTSNLAEALAFTSILDSKAPDLELIFAAADWQDQGLSRPQRHAYTIAAVAVAPKSRGSVRLKSRNPTDAPRIDFGLLSDPDSRDATVLLEGFRLARRVAATEPLRSETLRECPQTADLHSDDDLLAFFRREIQNMYHPTSTCRMGADDAAPVSSELRVRGVDKLWVVDASVMPAVPRGHPNAVVAMIAKRGAELIQSADPPQIRMEREPLLAR